MNTIVKTTADDVLHGVESSFLMPEAKKKRLTTLVLEQLLTEKGISLNQNQLAREVDKALWRRRFTRRCPLVMLFRYLFR